MKRQRAKRASCMYVATRGTKHAATKLAGDLKRDGYRTRVTKAHGAYSIFSCGRRKR